MIPRPISMCAQQPTITAPATKAKRTLANTPIFRMAVCQQQQMLFNAQRPLTRTMKEGRSLEQNQNIQTCAALLPHFGWWTNAFGSQFCAWFRNAQSINACVEYANQLQLTINFPVQSFIFLVSTLMFMVIIREIQGHFIDHHHIIFQWCACPMLPRLETKENTFIDV